MTAALPLDEGLRAMGVALEPVARERLQAHLDLVAKDRKDRTPGCERRSFRPFHLKIFTD